MFKYCKWIQNLHFSNILTKLQKGKAYLYVKVYMDEGIHYKW